jgi:hypothetical protein
MQIVFFPWLFLKEPITLGPFTFQNFRDKDGRITPSFTDLEAPMKFVSDLWAAISAAKPKAFG